jgi:hypothetical protein
MRPSISATMEFPMFVSNRTFKSTGQKYLIFRDRLELRTILFGTFTINFVDLERVELRQQNVKIMWKELWKYKTLHYALKLDLADFYEHLGVYKKSGWVKLLLFTPENPVLFKQHLERALSDFKKSQHSVH